MIEVKSVSKSFGGRRVLHEVSFTVRNGEVVGYVGLNGAGKTTTIRIAVGVLPPDSGDVYIDGHSVTNEKRAASRLVGWVPESPIFEHDFKAIDYFVYLAGYYGYSTSEARRLGRELLEMVGLGDALNKKLAAYSQGMKKRFALTVSLINDPPNFIFDEVLNGLDPQGIAFFRDLTSKFKRQNKAVLFSSHILSEVQGLADRVVFIHRGKIIGVYTMDEIARSAKPAIIVRVDRVDNVLLSKLSSFGETRVEGDKIIVSNPSADPAEINKAVFEAGYKVLELKASERTLEEFFFDLIKRAEEGMNR